MVTKGGKAVGIVMSVIVFTPQIDQRRRVQTFEIFLSLCRDIKLNHTEKEIHEIQNIDNEIILDTLTHRVHRNN